MMVHGKILGMAAACPICKKSAKPRGDNAAFPFCSARCKQVDLYHWLYEDYRVPAADQTPDEAEEKN